MYNILFIIFSPVVNFSLIQFKTMDVGVVLLLLVVAAVGVELVCRRVDPLPIQSLKANHTKKALNQLQWV